MAEADRLCDALRGRGWITAKALATQNPDWDERHLRRLAELSDGRILSGQDGYKLTVECTPEELGHATAWLRAQALKMMNRSLRIAAVWHEAPHTRH